MVVNNIASMASTSLVTTKRPGINGGTPTEPISIDNILKKQSNYNAGSNGNTNNRKNRGNTNHDHKGNDNCYNISNKNCQFMNHTQNHQHLNGISSVQNQTKINRTSSVPLNRKRSHKYLTAINKATAEAVGNGSDNALMASTTAAATANLCVVDNSSLTAANVGGSTLVGPLSKVATSQPIQIRKSNGINNILPMSVKQSAKSALSLVNHDSHSDKDEDEENEYDHDVDDDDDYDETVGIGVGNDNDRITMGIMGTVSSAVLLKESSPLKVMGAEVTTSTTATMRMTAAAKTKAMTETATMGTNATSVIGDDTTLNSETIMDTLDILKVSSHTNNQSDLSGSDDGRMDSTFQAHGNSISSLYKKKYTSTKLQPVSGTTVMAAAAVKAAAVAAATSPTTTNAADTATSTPTAPSATSPQTPTTPMIITNHRQNPLLVQQDDIMVSSSIPHHSNIYPFMLIYSDHYSPIEMESGSPPYSTRVIIRFEYKQHRRQYQ